MSANAYKEDSSSLLKELVSELEEMNDFDKKQLLIQLRKEKLMIAAKRLDAQSSAGVWTDDEVRNYIKKVRRAYNKKNKTDN